MLFPNPCFTKATLSAPPDSLPIIANACSTLTSPVLGSIILEIAPSVHSCIVTPNLEEIVLYKSLP